MCLINVLIVHDSHVRLCLWLNDSNPNKLAHTIPAPPPLAVWIRGSVPHSIHPSEPLQSSLQTHYLASLPKCIPNNPYKSYNLGQVNESPPSPLFSLFSGYFRRAIIQPSPHHSVRKALTAVAAAAVIVGVAQFRNPQRASWSNPSSSALDFMSAQSGLNCGLPALSLSGSLFFGSCLSAHSSHSFCFSLSPLSLWQKKKKKRRRSKDGASMNLQHLFVCCVYRRAMRRLAEDPPSVLF